MRKMHGASPPAWRGILALFVAVAVSFQTMASPGYGIALGSEAPTASFIPDVQTAGFAPITVTFTDTSAGDPTAWLWEFGDGDTSSERNPTHIYRLPGRHTVRLTVSNAFGDNTVVRSGLIVVDRRLSDGAAPQVDATFNATITNGGALTDADDGTKGDVCGAPPNNGFWYDLGARHWISRAAVKAMHGSSGYTSRIAIYGSNDNPASGTPDWKKIYDTGTNTAEGGLRQFAVAGEDSGPWRYVRFQMVSRSISSTCNRWFTADIFGTEAAIRQAGTTAHFAVDPHLAVPTFYPTSAPNVVRSPIDATATYSATGYSSSRPASGAADGTVGTSANGTNWIYANMATDGSVWWKIEWSAPQNLTHAILYDAGQGSSQWYFGDGQVELSDGTIVPFTGLPNNAASGSASLRVDLPERKTGITSLIVRRTGTGGLNPSYVGLMEVQAFDDGYVKPDDGVDIQFNDLSTGDPVAWAWDFGDGGTSTEQSPTHRFAAFGAYTVSLRVTDANGASHTTSVAGAVVLYEDLSPSVVPTTDGSLTAGTMAAINDGNDSTKGNLTCCPSNLFFDLGSEHAVAGVRVKHNYNARIAFFVSDDNSTWTKLYDDGGNTGGTGLRNLLLPAHLVDEYRYVRITMVSRSINSSAEWFTATVLGADLVTPTGDHTSPTADFATPDEHSLTTQDETSIELSWSENDTGGIAARSLQRYRVEAFNGGCEFDINRWELDGTAVSDLSPVTVAGLPGGYCYRWELTLTDGADNQGRQLSGTLLVDTTAPTQPTIIDNIAEPELVNTTFDASCTDAAWSGNWGTYDNSYSGQAGVCHAAGAGYHPWIGGLNDGHRLRIRSVCDGRWGAYAISAEFYTGINGEVLSSGNTVGVCDAWGLIDGTVTIPAGATAMRLYRPNDTYYSTLRVTDLDVASPNTFRQGNLIFFDPSAAGEIDLTAGGNEPDSAVAGHTFNGSHLSSTGFDDGDPQERTVSWPADADEFTVVVTTTNAAGLESDARTLTFIPDDADPLVVFSSPSALTQLRTEVPEHQIGWLEFDDANGVVSRSLQRQRAVAHGIGECPGKAYSNDGTPEASAGPVTQALEPGYCYRWTQTLTDGAGRTGSTISGLVYVAPRTGPTVDFVTPPADAELVVAIDGEDTDALAGWPGTRVDVGGNYQMKMGGQTLHYYGPAYPAEAGEQYRFSLRGFPAGPHAYFGLCFYGASGVKISCPTSSRVAAGDHRDTLLSRVATAPTGTVSVKVDFYHAYYSSYYDEVRIEQISQDADSTVVIDDELEVAWTEGESPQGLPVAGRSIQQQRAAASSYTGCAAAAFANDGTASTAASPVAATGLEPGYCYRWQVTITDTDGNAAVYTSGTRYVVEHGLRLEAPPATAEGVVTPIPVIISDVGGALRDEFIGVLTISSDDPNAIFPDGTTISIDGPDSRVGRTFRAQFSAGTHTVTVRGPNAEVATASISVANTTLSGDAQATVYAGVPFIATWTPTSDQRVATAYATEMTFTSTDSTAAYAGASGTPPSLQIECACANGAEVTTTLSTLGEQTITAADEFGNSAQVTVDVVAAPSMGGVPGPVQSIEVVQWRHGSMADVYLTAYEGVPAFQIVKAFGICGQSAAPGDSVNLTVDPAVDRHVEFSVRVPLNGYCPGPHLSELANHAFQITNGSGHFWYLGQTDRSLRFSEVPNNSNFRMLNLGDPIIDFDVLSRPKGDEELKFNGEEWIYGSGSLSILWNTHEPTTITELVLGRPGIAPYTPPWKTSNQRVLAEGTTVTAHDDLTMACYIGNTPQGVNSGWISYGSPSGYGGAFANGGGIIPQATGTTSEDWCHGATPGSGKSRLTGELDGLNPANWPSMAGQAVDRFLEGDPVDPFSGAFTQPVTDFALGGLSPALSLTRTYRSDRADAAAAGDADAAGAFGAGWGANIDQRLVLDDAPQIISYVTADGGVMTFAADNNGDYAAAAGQASMELVADGTNWVISSTGGMTHTFNASGQLIALGDRSNRELTVAYDGGGHLDSMTDGAGRTADITTAGGLVTRVDLPDGRYVAFTYNSAGAMTSARDMAGEVLTYEVDARGRLTGILDDEDHRLLTNVYDGAGRVVEQRNALGEATYFEFDPINRLAQMTGPRGDITTSCYDSGGNLVGRVDALGGLRSWTYDSYGHTATATDEIDATTTYTHTPEGELTSLTTPLGQTTDLSLRTDGQMSSMVDPAGNIVEAVYDTSGALVEIVRKTPSGATTPDEVTAFSMTHTTAGLPESVTDPEGGTIEYEYDSRGYLIGITDAAGRETRFTVDGRGLVTETVSPLGNLTGATAADYTAVKTYDAMGRVLTETNELDQTATYTYDAFGRLLTATSPLGHVTTNAYDLEGRLLTTTTQIGTSATATTTFEYDDAGNVTASIDAEGRRSETEYDLLNRVILVRDATGAEWETEYDAAGRMVHTVDPTGATESAEYDAAGRLTARIDAAGARTEYTYDELDQLISETDALEEVTTYAYDWMGRLDSVTNAENEMSTYTHDDAGRLLTALDPLSHGSTYTYNLAGQMTMVVDAAAGEWEFTYDGAGRLVERTNARGHTETVEYDRLNRPTASEDALGNRWESHYDADGRLSHTIDANGQRTDFSHRADGELLAISPVNGDPVTFTLDDAGRRLSMADVNGTTAYVADDVGRLTSVTRGGRTVSYAYDDAGRPVSVTYPGSVGTVDYSYDTSGRLVTVSDWDDRSTTFGYDDAGQITLMERPDGLETAYSYDGVGRLMGISHIQNSVQLSYASYTYDDGGRVVGLSDPSGAASFAYDDLNRLLSADYAGADDFAFAYDAVGNMTSITRPGQAALARTYDAADRLVTEGSSRTFTYDHNGNLLNDGAGRTYAYDELGRLEAVNDGTDVLTYTLDGAGNRWAETIGGTTTNFDLDLRSATPSILFDGDNLYLPGDPSLGHETNGTWRSGLADAAGTVTGYADANGLVGSLRETDPFGAPRSGAAVPEGIGYTGEWSDPMGLLNLRHRAYDPTLQRFLGRDTFGGVASAGQTWNRYAYVTNNPLGYTDPTGHFGNAINQHGGELLSFGAGMFTGWYDAISGVIGYDVFAGRAIEGGERLLYMAGAFGPLGKVVKHLGLAARMAKARAADALAGAAGRLAGSTRSFLRAIKQALPERASRLSEWGSWKRIHFDTLPGRMARVPAPSEARSLRELAERVRRSGLHPIARNQRTIAVGSDLEGRLFAGSSSGFDLGQRRMTDALGIERVGGSRSLHAEEELLRAVPDLDAVGTSARTPCGPAEHNCLLQLEQAGVRIEQ